MTLDQGIAVTVEFTGRSDVTDAPGTLSWPSTDCPIELRQLDHTIVSAKPETQTFIFSFVHFPRTGQVTFQPTFFSAPQVVQVGPNRVLRIKLPPQK